VEFPEREMLEFISQLLWPSNSPDLNLVDYIEWSIGLLQEKVYKTRITVVLDDLKHHIRIRTEWAKLRHIIIAAAVRQWRRRLSDFTLTTFHKKLQLYIYVCQVMPETLLVSLYSRYISMFVRL